MARWASGRRSERTAERLYVRCGETEIRFGMQWTVEYSLGEDDLHAFGAYREYEEE